MLGLDNKPAEVVVVSPATALLRPDPGQIPLVVVVVVDECCGTRGLFGERVNPISKDNRNKKN